VNTNNKIMGFSYEQSRKNYALKNNIYLPHMKNNRSSKKCINLNKSHNIDRVIEEYPLNTSVPDNMWNLNLPQNFSDTPKTVYTNFFATKNDREKHQYNNNNSFKAFSITHSGQFHTGHILHKKSKSLKNCSLKKGINEKTLKMYECQKVFNNKYGNKFDNKHDLKTFKTRASGNYFYCDNKHNPFHKKNKSTKYNMEY